MEVEMTRAFNLLFALAAVMLCAGGDLLWR